MHANVILTRVLEPCLAKLHAKRQQSLARATAGLLSGGIASLSAIALRLSGSTTLKHRLKSVDRLLGNGTLHQVRDDIYRRLAQCWLAPLSRILIVSVIRGQRQLLFEPPCHHSERLRRATERFNSRKRFLRRLP